MELTSIIITLAALFSVASADNVRYNTFYDNSQISLNNVACSDGRNGLIILCFGPQSPSLSWTVTPSHSPVLERLGLC
ncbi:hypothetical protein EDB83DRAFT_2389765 [Lactarius deliciosus]|nr:hypothetical protein EDB83DRAFT_2389765 [Lactarius deliciosus]